MPTDSPNHYGCNFTTTETDFRNDNLLKVSIAVTAYEKQLINLQRNCQFGAGRPPRMTLIPLSKIAHKKNGQPDKLQVRRSV